MRVAIEVRPGRTMSVMLINKDLEDAPTLFFLHGLGGRAAQWRKQIEFLQHKYRLVIPDLIGRGYSDKPRQHGVNPYAFSELNQDVQALFTRYSGSQNVVIGHSYGGALATFLTASNQDKVTKLILIAPSLCQPLVKVPFLIHYLPPWALEIIRPIIERGFRHLAFGPNATKELIAEELGTARSNPMYIIKQLILGMREVPRLDVKRITTPTLIIASKKDLITSARSIKKFYGQLPKNTYVVLEKTGHMSMLERSDRVNSLIEDFLNLQ
jgi:pimeloyl-ACP methyl ester carboxylesterase